MIEPPIETNFTGPSSGNIKVTATETIIIINPNIFSVCFAQYEDDVDGCGTDWVSCGDE